MAALLFVPHLALGTWLLVVPDHVAFVETQVVTLAHVGLALLTVPLILLLGWKHARTFRRRPRETLVARGAKWLLAAAGLGAGITGLAAFFAYARAASTLHAAFGIALGIPLAGHLLLASRRLTGAVVIALCAVSAGWAIHGRATPPSEPLAPVTPPPDYKLRAAAQYEDAGWCARCHRAEYDEWRQSTHAFTFTRVPFTSALADNQDPLGHTLAEAGALVNTPGQVDPSRGVAAVSACTACHAPLAFYSNAGDPSPNSPANEGIGCAFCHTLRAIRNDGHFPEGARQVRNGDHNVDVKGLLAGQPYYVSAPETVRRYMFPRTWLGDMLIRWRPSMHQHDYASAITHTDLSCRGCHPDAASSAEVATLQQHGLLQLAPGQERTSLPGQVATSRCTDCHMAAEPSHFWERPKRSHLFMGGNVEAARVAAGDALAAEAHAFAAGSVTCSIAHAALAGSELSVAIKLRNEHIPHAFPAFEAGGGRFAWVRVKALDANGRIIADTLQQDGGPADSLRITVDSVIGPREERTLRASLPVPPGAHPAEVMAELYKSLDPDPIARTRLALPQQQPQPGTETAATAE